MPRIRTVKPEYWSHPVLSKMSDSARLAAIALLNFADDEGYFYAAPQVVRSFIWPFDEDSTKTRRTIAELCKIGFIEIREHEQQGQIGWIVNFKKHQRIDRATPSRIASYFNECGSTINRGQLDESSTNPRRWLDDGSTLEGNGREGNGKELKGEDTPPSCDGLPSPRKPKETFDSEFEAFWKEYPRRVNKTAAARAFRASFARYRQRTGSDIESFTGIVRTFAQSDKGAAAGEYCPHPATWLNNDRWGEDPAEWKDRKTNGYNAAAALNAAEQEAAKGRSGF